MEKDLPIADIAGTVFYVDVLLDELRQTDNPPNRISFNELEESEKGYSFLYDTRTKNIPGVDADLEKETGRYVWVTLPALMELDPEGISRKYGIPLEVLSPDFPYEGSSVTAKIRPLHAAGNNRKK